MLKMENAYRKTMMIVAALALITVMFTPTAMAQPDLEDIVATWESPNIVATATDFKHPGKWYQFRFYQPGTNYTNSSTDVGPYNQSTEPTGYFKSDPWKPVAKDEMHTYYFDVVSNVSGDYYGEWAVWLFKAGVSPNPPDEGITSDRVSTTVDVPIPEFTTIAIPAIALLGLFAFSRRKQKK